MSSLSSLFSPPYNPPYGQDKTGQARQTKQKNILMDFNKFLTLFQPDSEFTSRLGAAQRLWNQSSEAKQQAIIAWLEIHGSYKGRNPYFFILDFKPQQMQLSYADYYARFGTTEEVDGWQRRFLPEQQKTIYVKN